MKTYSSRVLALVYVLCVSIGIPDKNWAAPQETEVRAGEVSRVIFAVSIERGTRSISATTKTVVDWQDLINTQANARARVALDDGSVLNVGSSSSIRVVKHDVKARQTDLEIGLGRMRTQVQKIPQPNGKFEVRTPAGVAGVVGTDFYVSYENNIMTVIVFEGVVRAEPKVKYPLCLEGARACPPEDCGGVWGYADFVEAVRDESHEEHEELLEWAGGEFDPEAFDATVATWRMRHGLPDWRKTL